MVSKRKKSARACALACLVLLFAANSALGEWIRPDWRSVQGSLDCNGFTVQINAVTDAHIPETASEWSAGGRVWTEEELRTLLAIVSPGDEHIGRLYHEDKNDIVLCEDIMGISGFTYLGEVSITHEDRKNGQNQANFPNIYYQSHEPIQEPVPDLSAIRFEEALAFAAPVADALGCGVGYPAEVEAWDLDTLQKNHDWFQEHLPDAGFPDRQWAASDEYYRMVFPAYFQGVRLNMIQGEQHPKAEDADALIDVRVDAQGIVDFQLRNCLFSEARPLCEPQKILTLEEAVQSYQKMRSSMLESGGKPLVITKILLEYVVLKDFPITMKYRLVPA